PPGGTPRGWPERCPALPWVHPAGFPPPGRAGRRAPGPRAVGPPRRSRSKRQYHDAALRVNPAGETLPVDVGPDVGMRTVVRGDHGVLVQAVVPDMRPGGAFRHQAIATHVRRRAEVDLERDVGGARVGDEWREVPLAARLRGDRGDPPASDALELGDGCFEGLPDGRGARTDQAPGQLPPSPPPDPQASRRVRRDRIDWN